MLLTIAGSETTRNAVSQGLVALLDHEEQLDQLRGDPGAISTRGGGGSSVVLAGFIFCPKGDTGHRNPRHTHRPGRQGNHVVPIGQPRRRRLCKPYRFDITRSPNPHVTFGGGGVHFCLGAYLARRELATLLEVLFERSQFIELAGDTLLHVPSGSSIQFALHA